MSPLIAGTLCVDTIETPHGVARRVLGGSGAYAAYAAAFVAAPHLVSVVGDDFPPAAREALAAHGVALDGVHVRAGCRTQFWHGRYSADLHTRDHVDVDMTVFDGWDPVVPEALRGSPHVLLAHMPPHLQCRVLDQLRSPAVVVADTIDHWITTQRADVLRLLPRVTHLVVNDQEARLLSGEDEVLRAAWALRGLGPETVVVKEGRHGAVVATADGMAALPAYPTETVVDPTGAGDTFAGGLIGSLAAGSSLRRALAHGTVLASFTVEGFGLAGLTRITRADFAARWEKYREMLTV